MGPTLQALEDSYIYMNANFDDIETNMTDAQKTSFVSKFVLARSNYWQSIHKILHDDDPDVAALVTQMNVEQQKLEADVSALANVATILNDITTVVKTGAAIAAKAV